MNRIKETHKQGGKANSHEGKPQREVVENSTGLRDLCIKDINGATNERRSTNDLRYKCPIV